MAAVGQIVLKAGMSTNSVLQSLSDGFGLSASLTIFTNPLVVIGLGLYFGAALVWLLVLARIDVSLAYPFVGLGFVLTMAFGWLFLGEHLTIARILGTLLITSGVVVLARS